MKVKTADVSKVYDAYDVLKRININVAEESIYGLLGPNGAGKSTLLKMLSGLNAPSLGEIYFNGNSLHIDDGHVKPLIGSVIETPVFYNHLSAHENLSIHLEYMDTDHLTIEEALIIVGLKTVGGLPVAKFSLGMRQRLAIARAFIHLPELLVLDEPLNGLDPKGIKEMRALFKRLKDQFDMTLIISSHILNEIEHVADEIGILHKGELLTEVSMQTLKVNHPDGIETFFFNMTEGDG